MPTLGSIQVLEEATGEGRQELRPPVCQKRSGRPDFDVYRSRFEPLSPRLGPLVVESLPLGYKDVLWGFEELWMSGAGSAEELEVLQRHAQGCVEPARGFEDPKLPLSVPTTAILERGEPL
jgi:hypothetical protein